MGEVMKCPACAGDLPEGSRFCPGCGAALAEEGTVEMFTHRPSGDTRELLAEQSARPAMSVHEAHRRPLGAPPAALLGAITLGALLVAIILIATGAWIGAVIALGVFLGACTLFLSAIRHDPNSTAALLTRRSTARARTTARFVAVAARAWARAGMSLLHIMQQRVRLRHELRRQLSPLGAAVHEGDQTRAAEIKAHAEELERKLAESDRQASSAIEQAREIVEREKATAQPTQTLRQDDIHPTLAEDTQPHTQAAPPTRHRPSPHKRAARNGRASLPR